MRWLVEQERNFEKNRFGAMTIMITFQSCLGSVAAMLAIQDNNWFLVGVVAVLTMSANSMFIAQADAKPCIITFYVSIIANAFIILLSLIV
ncbi:hypothetical protein [Brumimicrobium oceani]|uniref:Uncharacterized protein n=1 Tax=Brumimicrobium oceani TaxID=2100725 RepID=A0A2U2X0K7_9FLAO|nr:hypothetical protein [Brumimicrobium oceani]PWH81312.1 hypothetical protein DIT68_15360 [Brumimicrobium oceani]